jgi:hypothetical protein
MPTKRLSFESKRGYESYFKEYRIPIETLRKSGNANITDERIQTPRGSTPSISIWASQLRTWLKISRFAAAVHGPATTRRFGASNMYRASVKDSITPAFEHDQSRNGSPLRPGDNSLIL